MQILLILSTTTSRCDRDRVNELLERLQISEIEHLDRRVTVPTRPRQTNVQHTISHKVRTISSAIRRAHLYWYLIRPRDVQNSIEFRKRSDGRVVEATNDCAMPERCVRKARALNRRIRRDERVNAVDSLHRRSILLRQCSRAFKSYLFTH